MLVSGTAVETSTHHSSIEWEGNGVLFVSLGRLATQHIPCGFTAVMLSRAGSQYLNVHFPENKQAVAVYIQHYHSSEAFRC